MKTTNPFDAKYNKLVRHILKNGIDRTDRTGTGTRSVFGYQMRFDISEKFPLLTTKYISFKTIVHELLWFISGSTTAKDLHKNDVHIWDAWVKDRDMNLGPVYGKQWRSFGYDSAFNGIDQLANVIRDIKETSDSRRLIVSAWNPVDVPHMALPPCHMMFQFYVHDSKLSCQLYQRSADVFLGLPFNIASYALLTYLIAQVTGLMPHEFIHTIGDAHIYNNHVNQVNEQLSRKSFEAPWLFVNDQICDIDDFRHTDIWLNDYKHHAAIKGEISV